MTQPIEGVTLEKAHGTATEWTVCMIILMALAPIMVFFSVLAYRAAWAVG